MTLRSRWGFGGAPRSKWRPVDQANRIMAWARLGLIVAAVIIAIGTGLLAADTTPTRLDGVLPWSATAVGWTVGLAVLACCLTLLFVVGGRWWRRLGLAELTVRAPR
ncbi:hypothetical protein [Pseudonocardia sp. GCM10023141]|uniref:hypothetical protein n=1 Tax=Pseudonocardia sp. GCM10023141 TaxID=3252653 RepID=UPI00360DF7E3